jgi:hypothetical protein
MGVIDPQIVTEENATEQVTALLAESKKVGLEVSPIVSQAQAIAEAVKDRPSYDAAIAHGRLLKAKETWAVEALDPFCKFFKRLHANAVSERDKWVVPCKAGQAIIGRSTAAWEAEQNRIRIADENRLAAEARKRDEDAKLNAAEAAEKSGDAKLAERIINMPTITPQIVLPGLPTAGRSTRTTWKAECFDLMALVKAVAAGKEPIHYLEANMVTLNKQANLAKENMNVAGPSQVPGVRAISDTKNNFKAAI